MPTSDPGDRMDWDLLAARREPYTEAIPPGVLILTAGIDVQDDRLEAELVGWGAGEESWSIEFVVFHGDPGRDNIWKDLEAWLTMPRRINIDCVMIDSGGHFTQEVYAFCRPRALRRVHPIRGNPQTGRPVISRASAKNKAGVRVITLGVDTAKAHLMNQARVVEIGPGYMHFPSSYEEEYFRQLTAEECRTRFVRGYERREWHKTRKRNEALDCRVYAYSGLCMLGPGALDVAAQRASSGADEKPPTEQKPPPRRSPTPWAVRV